ncbi:MAG: Lrp/AsnC family transcriptional regulator [Sporolactobacillus sp.]|jgi:DNA-binding Lrp family transcriptional regulator|nr:Lrp/AsnC family transcriptional regulator [Sporolactobacillus sp.]MCI1881123.1 Lrp/AsnC family transcriptional regulator [Sporolactobacillus sp.]
MKLDNTDRKILQCLTEDGRMSYVDIGKHLELSRVAIRERVQQMVKNGVIEKFSVVINSELAGKTVSAFYEVECEPSSLLSVGRKLAANPNVASCYQMTGPCVLHVHVLVEDFHQLENFTNKELYSMQGITRVNSHILLRRFKSRTGLKL